MILGNLYIPPAYVGTLCKKKKALGIYNPKTRIDNILDQAKLT